MLERMLKRIFTSTPPKPEPEPEGGVVFDAFVSTLVVENFSK